MKQQSFADIEYGTGSGERSGMNFWRSWMKYHILPFPTHDPPEIRTYIDKYFHKPSLTKANDRSE